MHTLAPYFYQLDRVADEAEINQTNQIDPQLMCLHLEYQFHFQLWLYKVVNQTRDSRTTK